MRGISRGGRRNGVYAPSTVRGALSRECPKCGAKPNWRCVYRIKGTDAYKVLKTFHKERHGA